MPREDTEAKREKAHGDGGRGWNHAAARQGVTRATDAGRGKEA